MTDNLNICMKRRYVSQKEAEAMIQTRPPGFEPKVKIKQGIQEFIAWCKEYFKG